MSHWLLNDAEVLPVRGRGARHEIYRQAAGALRRRSWILVLVAAHSVFTQSWAATNAAEEAGVPQLAPPYPEIPPTFWEQYGAAVLLCGMVLVALAAFGLWLGLRKKPLAVVPPEILAKRELAVLLRLPEDGVVLSRTSQVLRRYFIAAFALPPGEFTTAEFCRSLSGCEKIGADLTSAVTAFLQECDARKFSSGAVPLSGAVARAQALVERGEAQRSPPQAVKP